VPSRPQLIFDACRQVGDRGGVYRFARVHLDEYPVEIERLWLGFAPSFRDLFRLVLGGVARMPVCRGGPLPVALGGNVQRTPAVNLDDRSAEGVEVVLGETPPEVTLEYCALALGCDGVHHAVRREAETPRPFEVSCTQDVVQGLLDRVFRNERELELSCQRTSESRLPTARHTCDHDEPAENHRLSLAWSSHS
jgi:hypothetical protein